MRLARLQVKEGYMNEQDTLTVEAMEKYGGSFIVALANLARRADHINLAKIKAVFAEYWTRYEEMSRE